MVVCNLGNKDVYVFYNDEICHKLNLKLDGLNLVWIHGGGGSIHPNYTTT